MSTKYIFVTGGVVSSIGKGIVAASLGRLLKNRGLKVTIQKFDPPCHTRSRKNRIHEKILISLTIRIFSLFTY